MLGIYDAFIGCCMFDRTIEHEIVRHSKLMSHTLRVELFSSIPWTSHYEHKPMQYTDFFSVTL